MVKRTDINDRFKRVRPESHIKELEPIKVELNKNDGL